MKKPIAARAVRTEGERRGMKYFAAGDAKGPDPVKAPVAGRGSKGKRKPGNHGPKQAKAEGPKALVAEIVAAA